MDRMEKEAAELQQQLQEKTQNCTLLQAKTEQYSVLIEKLTASLEHAQSKHAAASSRVQEVPNIPNCASVSLSLSLCRFVC